MLQPVTQDNFGSMDDGVVACALFKGFFCQPDLGCFAFNQYFRLGSEGYEKVDSF